jgi:DNA-binding LacI/PurR family transcriptional regulator
MKRQHERMPTIATVAEMAGVSRQTVSNVVRAPHRVSPQTLERVQAIIREVDYRPNRSARALQARSTGLLAYRCHRPEETENLVLDRFLHDLCRAADEHEHHITLVSPVSTDQELAMYRELYRSGRVDGFVLSGTHPGDQRLVGLVDESIPFVSFGQNWDAPEASTWVDVDGATGIRLATEHYWRNGHRRIAFLGWPDDGAVGAQRRRGYVSATSGFRIEPIEASCFDRLDSAEAAATELLSRPDRPTAVVCVSDTAALGCAWAAQKLGIAVGAELGIMGFDDSTLTLIARPSLSSVRQPTDQVAQALIDRFIGLTQSDTPTGTLLAPSLVHRGSS